MPNNEDNYTDMLEKKSPTPKTLRSPEDYVLHEHKPPNSKALTKTHGSNDPPHEQVPQRCSANASYIMEWMDIPEGSEVTSEGGLKFRGGTYLSPDDIDIKIMDSRLKYRHKITPWNSKPKSILSSKSAFHTISSQLTIDNEDFKVADANLSPYHRAICFPAHKLPFLQKMITETAQQFKGDNFQHNNKLIFEEASPVFAGIIDSAIFDKSERFEDIFSNKKLAPNVGFTQLECNLGNIPDSLLEEDLKVRRNVLDAMTLVSTLDAWGQVNKNKDCRDMILSLTKLASRPLAAFLERFCVTRLKMRKAALANCALDFQCTIELRKSNPFSVKLFPEKQIQYLRDRASAMGNSIKGVLGLKDTSTKRKHNYQGPLPKRARFNQPHHKFQKPGNPQQEYTRPQQRGNNTFFRGKGSRNYNMGSRTTPQQSKRGQEHPRNQRERTTFKRQDSRRGRRGLHKNRSNYTK